MKIAVVGLGLCGLSAAYFLQKAYPKAFITLMDEVEEGAGASHIAAGMVHTLAGHEGKKAPEGAIALQETLSLIRVAEKKAGKKLFIPGLLRIPRDKRFREPLYHSDPKKWMGFDETFEKSKGSIKAEGLWIEEGGCVFVKEYLAGLFDFLKEKGCKFEKKKLLHSDELEKFDLSVLALGAHLKDIGGIKPPPMTYKLGQIAHLDIAPPPFPIIGRAYCAPSADLKGTIVGGTYEEATAAPNKSAMDKLIEYASVAYEPLKEARGGKRPFAVRAYGPNKRPFIEEVAKGVWAFGGVGSKGLLYHALLAKRLAEKIVGK